MWIRVRNTVSNCRLTDDSASVVARVVYYYQGCGSGSGLDPDSETCVDPDPYWESGSRGQKTKKFQWKNALFSYLKKKFTTKKA
jgi:hypothetical protein